MALDVRHGLTFDLQSISDPHHTHDLIEGRLKQTKIIYMNRQTPTKQVLRINHDASQLPT